MNNFPDFSQYGYQIIKQLNYNSQGGRITYLAEEIGIQQLAIIKQFRFARGGNWDDYKAIEKEIQTLKGLIHSGIPRYFTQFDSGDGLCLVQQYIDAQPLSTSRDFSREELKSIANQILEILVYLQQRMPPVLHRDLKPENILIDENLKAYLVDFGLARMGDNTLAISSLFGGTLGFMPPEQVQNQKLTKASDLYGLGATLICLITKTKSVNIGSLVDFSTNKITFKDQVPQLDLRFGEWLEKMVEPNPVNRYPDAKSALNELNKDVPEIASISYSEVLSRLGIEDLDALHCSVLANQAREVTANKKNQISVPPYTFIGVFGLSLAIISGVSIQVWQWVNSAIARQNFLFAFCILTIALAIAFILGGEVAFAIAFVIGLIVAKCVGGLIGYAMGGTVALIICAMVNQSVGGRMLSGLKKKTDNILECNFLSRGFDFWMATLYILLTAAVGIFTGVASVIGFTSSLIFALSASALPLVSLLVGQHLRGQK